MAKFYLSFILLILVATPIFSQNPYIKISVYFETDQHILTNNQKIDIDNLIADINGKEIVKVIIRGNTDTDADSIYNVKLSEKRTTNVANYLAEKKLDKSKFETDHYGENKPKATNSNELGKQQNRRVDIIIIYKIPIDIKEPPVVIIDDEVQLTSNENCDKDTIIYLPGGSQVKMNACEYREKKDCIVLKEYITPESIQAAGFVTMDENGNELQSGGMLTFETCDTSCLQSPALIRLPVPCNMSMDMMLYSLNADNTWGNPQDQIRIVSQGGNLFYEFPVECPYEKKGNSNTKNVDRIVTDNKINLNVDRPSNSITFNCDIRPLSGKRLFRPKTKFKAEKGMQFESVSLSTTCPLGQYNADLNKRRTKAVFKDIGCLAQSAEVRIVAKKEDKEIETGYKSLRMFKDVRKNRRCGTGNPKKIKVSMIDFTDPIVDDNIRM